MHPHLSWVQLRGMKVTFFALVLPFLILAAGLITGTIDSHSKLPGTPDLLLFFWIVGGFVVTCIYWVARVIRRGFRDGNHNAYERLNRL
jgi:hypothetical protein